MEKRCSQLFANLAAYRRRMIKLLVVTNVALAMYTVPTLLGDVVNNKPRSGDILSGTNTRQTQEAGFPLPNTYSFIKESGHADSDVFINQPTESCLEGETFLLIAVCSAVHHFELRQSIRQTWASVIRRYRISTRLVFVLGAPSAEYGLQLQAHVTRESQTFGDVIQADFVDSYVNLTLKTLAVLRWSLNVCPEVKYFMKTDDDVFINVANLIDLLMDLATSRRNATKPIMLGHVIKKAKPISNRNSKWYTPNALFKPQKYPDYLSGTAYVITGASIQRLYSAATSRPAFWLEDVYITGILPRHLGIELVHDFRFTYSKPEVFHPCFFRFVISAHQISPPEMFKIWRHLHLMEVDCSGYDKKDLGKSRRN